LIGDW
jgi:hypothetical protein